MNKITDYIKEIIAEAKNVNWPSRNQTIYSTVAVLVISLVAAYYLGVLDALFSKGLGLLIGR